MKKVLRKSIQTDIESELSAFFYQKDPMVSGLMTKHITAAAKLLSKKFIKLATKPDKLVKQGKVYSKLRKGAAKSASQKTTTTKAGTSAKKKVSGTTATKKKAGARRKVNTRSAKAAKKTT